MTHENAIGYFFTTAEKMLVLYTYTHIKQGFVAIQNSFKLKKRSLGTLKHIVTQAYLLTHSFVQKILMRYNIIIIIIYRKMWQIAVTIQI